MTLDLRPENEAPPILSLIAFIAAVVVVALVLPRWAGRRGWIGGLLPLVGFLLVAFPHRLGAADGYLMSQSTIRIIGWVLILLPLMTLLG